MQIAERPAPSETPALPWATPPRPVACPSGTALVVDDSRAARSVARQILRNLGFEVREAGDGCEALRVLDLWRTDLVLLDWNMPVMDGLAFLHAFGSSLRSKRPKIVICTAEHSDDRIRDAFAAGCDEYIMKPFDCETVEAKLRRIGAL